MEINNQILLEKYEKEPFIRALAKPKFILDITLREKKEWKYFLE